ncbi:MAG: hypothetical protein LBU15_00400 [Rickettsiales bacterium]|jgi:hypothetical protein|nr:hypothetical protein [Rickettsiales bacterium]
MEYPKDMDQESRAEMIRMVERRDVEPGKRVQLFGSFRARGLPSFDREEIELDFDGSFYVRERYYDGSFIQVRALRKEEGELPESCREGAAELKASLARAIEYFRTGDASVLKSPLEW